MSVVSLDHLPFISIPKSHPNMVKIRWAAKFKNKSTFTIDFMFTIIIGVHTSFASQQVGGSNTRNYLRFALRSCDILINNLNQELRTCPLKYKFLLYKPLALVLFAFTPTISATASNSSSQSNIFEGLTIVTISSTVIQDKRTHCLTKAPSSLLTLNHLLTILKISISGAKKVLRSKSLIIDFWNKSLVCITINATLVLLEIGR